MTRPFTQLGLTVATIALTFLFAFSQTQKSFATPVGAISYGDDLAGGTISVFFAQQGVQTAQIFAGGPGQGTSSLPNLFTFNVTGDTYVADWTLINNTTFDEIVSVEFDLSGTISQPVANGPVFSPGVLFDDNSAPSTPSSFAGRLGAVQVNVGDPVIIGSGETSDWTDAMNTGDMFVKEFIRFERFGPLMTAIWRDDTDIVGTTTEPELPEPSSAMLLLLAAGAGCFGRRRS
jgi:hypothetical protein